MTSTCSTGLNSFGSNCGSFWTTHKEEIKERLTNFGIAQVFVLGHLAIANAVVILGTMPVAGFVARLDNCRGCSNREARNSDRVKKAWAKNMREWLGETGVLQYTTVATAILAETAFFYQTVYQGKKPVEALKEQRDFAYDVLYNVCCCGCFRSDY